MELTNGLKQRFVKDYGLPIDVYEKDLFAYYIEELDAQYGTKSKLKEFENFLNRLGDQELFFTESTKLIDNVIAYVSQKESYKELELQRLDLLDKPNYPSTKDIYNLENVGSYFVSIDLVKANFQALKRFSSKLVSNKDNYEEFLGKFTDEDYFKKSKQIRQVVLGNLMPSKQQTICKEMINTIYNKLIESGLNKNKIATVMTDEIVIKCDNENDMQKVKNFVISLHPNRLSIEAIGSIECKLENLDIRVEAFKLNNIEGRKFFVKEFDDGKLDFKCIPSKVFLQAYKQYMGIELKDEDLMFHHDGSLAKYVEPIFSNSNLKIEEITR